MPPLTFPAVRAAMLEKLRSSLLTERHAKILHFQPMTEADAKAAGINPPWAGFKIPYFTPDGKIDKDFYRYRFWPDSKPSKGWASIGTPAKPLRYVQPANSELHVYMPPLIDGTWREVMEHAEIPLNITEGELKAACGCANDLVTLGLGGVFSWTSKRHHQDLIPTLELFSWKGRRVNLVFDSDRAANPLVQLAASRLALALLARGAVVYDVDMPPSVSGSKQGLDDYLFNHQKDVPGAITALFKDATEARSSVELHRLNDEIALIWEGGPAGNIIRYSDGHLMTPQQLTRSFYKDRTYMEYTIKQDGTQGTPRLKYAAEEWLAWRCRGRVRSITYAPGQPKITADERYNLWQPPGVVPIKGDVSPWEDLLSKMLSSAEPAHVLWFRRWLAYPLQVPGTKLFSCTLIWSFLGGTGKNLLAEALVPVYGESNCVTIGSSQLSSDFNGWAEGKQWVVGDEITLDATDRRHVSGGLKSRLTNRVIRINRKGIEAYEVPDCANYLLTSNDAASVTIEQGERRTFVIHAPEVRIGDNYGRRFKHWLNQEGGAAALAYALLNQPLGDFSPTAEPPDTHAKLELIANSRSDLESWCAALKVDPERLLTSARNPHYAAQLAGCANMGPYDVYTPEDLLKLYDPDDKKRASLRALGMCLGRVGFRKAQWNNGRLQNVRSTFWLIRNDDLTRPPISSAAAAKIYQQERPAEFRSPSSIAAHKTATQ